MKLIVNIAKTTYYAVVKTDDNAEWIKTEILRNLVNSIKTGEKINPQEEGQIRLIINVDDWTYDIISRVDYEWVETEIVFNIVKTIKNGKKVEELKEV